MRNSARLSANNQRGMIPAFLIWPLIYAGLAAILMGVTLWKKHSYDERRRDEGRAEVQKKWDVDKAMRIKRTTEITLALSASLMAAKDVITKQEAETHARFATLEARIGNLDRRRVTISAPAARVLHDIPDAANSAAATTTGRDGETRTDPVPAAAQTVVYDERELVAWMVKAGAAYSDAYNLWAAARTREDALREALTKLGEK